MSLVSWSSVRGKDERCVKKTKVTRRMFTGKLELHSGNARIENAVPSKGLAGFRNEPLLAEFLSLQYGPVIFIKLIADKIAVSLRAGGELREAACS